jgi:hypothetical protein
MTIPLAFWLAMNSGTGLPKIVALAAFYGIIGALDA